MATTSRKGTQVSWHLDDEEKQVLESAKATRKETEDSSQLLDETQKLQNEIYRTIGSDSYNDRETRVNLQKKLYKYQSNLKRLKADGYDVSESLSKVPTIQETVTNRSKLFNQFEDEFDYNSWKKYGSMSDKDQTSALEKLKQDMANLTSRGDTAGAESIQKEINWLYQKGGTAVRTIGRQEKYEENKKRLEELKQERAALNNSGSQFSNYVNPVSPYESYSNVGSTYAAAYNATYSNGTSYQRRKELNDEIDALETEIRMYERGEGDGGSKVVDDYFGYSQRDDFDTVSSNRDFSNPTREDLNKYDAISDSSSWYYDANGNLYDALGNKIDTSKTDKDGNIINQAASGYSVTDRLGMYLSASESEKQEAAGAVNGTEGTWESIIKDGMDGNWEMLSDNEVSIYYYLLNSTGQETADKYLSDMKTELNRRATTQYNQNMADTWDESSALEKLALSIASVPANLAGSVVSFIDDAANRLSGNEINPYSSAHSLQNFSNTVRSVTAENIVEATGGAKIPFINFTAGDLYQSGMSVLDMGAGILIGPTAYGAVMGMGSATKEATRLYQQGASASQISAGGFLAGLAEMVFEKVSIEKLISMKSAETIGQVVKNILVQSGIEASEEGFTEIANILTNAIVMGQQSDWNQELDSNGGDALKTFIGMVERVGQSAMAGAVAGAAGGGAGSVGSYIGNQIQYSSDGRAIMNADGGVEALRQLALDTAGVASEKTSGVINKLSEQVDTKNPSARKVGRLYQYANNAVSDSVQSEIAAKLESEGYTAKQAQTYAEVIVAQANGENLSDKQERTLKKAKSDSTVSKVVSEVMSDKESASAQASKKVGTFTLGVNMGVSFTAKSQQNEAESMGNSSEGESKAEPKKLAENHFEVSDDGSTIVEGKEDPVTIQSVESNVGGEMTLRLSDGSVVNASDVSYGSEDEAFVYSTIMDMGLPANASNLILESYRMGNGVSGVSFANGIQDAFRYGRFNYPASELANGVFTSELTEHQRMTAYRIGQTFGGKETSKETASVRKRVASSKNAQTGSNPESTGNVHYDGDAGTLTKIQQTSVSALKTVAEALGIQVYLFESETNSDGKHVGANGWFDPSDSSIHIDIYAGADGSGTMLFTAAHELTHFIKAWSPAKFKVLANFLMEEYGKKGVSVEELVQNQIDKAKNSQTNPRDLTYDEAFEEVVADSMETMLADGNVAEKLAKLKQKDQTLWEKIKGFISDLVGKIRTAYSKLNPDSAEGNYVKDMMDALENLQDLFTEGLVEASENYRATLTPGEEGTTYTANGDPVAHVTADGSVQLSMRTYEEEGRTEFRKYLEKCVSSKQLTKAEMQDMLDGIEDIYQTCKEFKDQYAPFSAWSDASVVRDTYGKPVFSVVTPNGEYKMNLDFSLVCKKRRTLDAVFNEMSRRGIIDDFELGQKSVVKINEIIRKHGFETACALCFVDAKRFRQASMADSFVNLYNELVYSLVPEGKRNSISHFNFAGNTSLAEVNGGIDTWSNADLDFSHLYEVMRNYGSGTVEYKAAKYIKTHAEGRKLLQRGDFMSSKGFDAVKTQNTNILKLYNSKKGTGGPKAAFGDVQYMNEIVKRAKTWTPAKAYAVGGVRIQPFSDYVPRMVFDYVQMIYDLAATKLPAHAYTKEALFAKQFGLTGVKINMSLIPAIVKDGIAAGLDANGDYVWAGESFDFETAKQIQSAEGYSENCGTICVGVSDLHIRKLISDPDIRMVIPYHKSGLNPIVAHMNRIAEFTDYTGSQNTLGRDGKKLKKDFDFNQALHKLGENADPKAVISEYLDWCDSNGYTPRFSQFRDNPNYYKLIEDFTLYDKSGSYVPQREVRAVFPASDSAFGSMKDLIKAGLEEDAVIEGKRDDRLSSIVDEIEQTIPRTEAEIKDEEVVQADRDLESDLADAGIKWSIREESPPKKVGVAYKVFLAKDGQLYPPMVANPNGEGTPVGVWLNADVGKAAPPSKTGRPQVQGGGKGTNSGKISLAFRPGWHLGDIPLAKQFAKLNPETGKKELFPANFVWAECEYAMDVDYQEEAMSYGYTENGKFRHSYAGLPRLPENGYYRYRTNPNPDTVPWVITGAMRVTRILTDAETDAICRENGVEPMARQGGPINLADFGLTAGDTTSDIKLSDRGYSYEDLTRKPDMVVTTVGGNVPKKRADVVAQAKKNAAKIGKFDTKTGSVSVHVKDVDADVVLSTNGLKHSLDRRFEVNAPVTVRAGTILQNSIRINKLTPQHPDALSSYILIGAAKNEKGELYIVRSVVNHFSNEVVSMDVLYAFNAKTEPDLGIKKGTGRELIPNGSQQSAATITDSTISISELLDYVNEYFPDILPEEVLKHYGYDARPDGKLGESALFSDRTDDSLSNRALLADAFENLAMNSAESEAIQKYKQVVYKLDAEQARLTDLRKQIKDLSFAKGPKDTKAIKALQFEANQVANRINTYDRQLLRLTAAKPLQDVLQREKKLAYKRAEQKGKDAMAAYREKVSQKNLELLNKYQESRKKAVDSRNRTALRHKIRGVVDELNSYLLHGTKDRHILIGLQKPVAESLEAINMDTVGAEERIAKLQQDLMKAKTPEKIQEISRKISHIQEMGENSARRLQDLKAAYDSFVDSDDPMVANAYDEVISLKLEAVIKEVGNTPLRNMTVSQLESVYDMYKMVLTRVRDSNKAFKQGKNQDIAILGNRVMDEVEKAGGKKKKQISALRGVSTFAWNNLNPIYAFERIGSETLTGVFNSVRSGEDTWATDVTDARAFYLDEVKKYGYNGWDFDKKYSFQSSSGMEFELNLEQIMSLYAYSKRKQAGDHLKYGGFVFDPKTEVYEKTKSGLKVKVNLTEATAYNLSAETLGDIIGTLTEDQKGFVDEMQDYLSSTMGEKGNEVSLEMYGVKLFKEQNYFPLKSATQFMAKAKEQAQGEVKIKNSGFSKETTPKARNPIVLSSFMDVWANHVNEMSMYHAFVLPIEDFYRVFNYKTPTAENMATESVEMYIQNAYGTGATQYIEQLLKDLNGGARADNTTGFANKFMGKFKKGAVFASASVVIQQPSAIARATALIDTKYFIGPKLDSNHHKATWEEVKKYAPVAIIKEMGYFDTNMGKSTKGFITAREYSGFSEKAKAMVTDSGYRDEILSKAPALADEIAWCGIWNAVKRETAAKHKAMNTKSEEFLKLAGERFTEVITKTQVYDSVLSRSAMMRSKDTVVKMATAFMAEPTTSINMIYDALVKGKKGNIKYARNAIGAVIASNILNAILVSFVYAGRDDDDDETYLEKYTGTLVGEIIDSFNPLTYIPFIKDIVSITQGYDVERSDMAVFSDLWNAYQALGKENVSGWKKVENFAGSIAQLFGLPVKNIMRDARTAYNIFQSAMSGQKTTKAGMKYSVLEAVTGNSVSNQNQLYNAYLEGDTAMISRVESRYKDEKAINSAIRTALAENDQRITQAAQAKVDGDLDEYMRIAKEIIGDGHFSQDNVVSSINSVINKLSKDDDESSESKHKGLFKADDFAESIVHGDSAMANAIKVDIIQTAQKNGKTEADATESFSNSAKNSCKELFVAGELTEDKAVNALVSYCGFDQEDADKKVGEWAFEKEYGFTWSDRGDAYKNGDISASELKQILMTTGEKTDEEADLQIQVYDWQKEVPGCDDITASAIRDYNDFCSGAGISKEIYYEAWTNYNDIHGDVDENGDSIPYSKVKKVMPYIGSLPLSADQKTALALCWWGESTVSKYKTW